MKIVVVAPYFAPRVGGLENYARGVAEGLTRAGHDVVVVTTSDQGRPRHDQVGALRVIRLPVLVRVSNTPVHPGWYRQLKAVFRAEAPDVVLAHTPVPFIADLAARAAGATPFVLTYHNDLTKDSRLLRAVIGLHWRLLGRGTVQRADRIVATSAAYVTQSRYLRGFSAKTVIVPPAVDAARFHPGVDGSPVQQRFAGRRLVLFVGSLARTHGHKGLGLLVEATALVRRTRPDVHLVVAGDGSGRADLEREVAERGMAGAVSFVGFVPDEELPRYYAAADVLVLPSTNESEGFGMVLQEAAACGTAVIGTRVGGIPAALASLGSANVAEPEAASIAEVLERVLAGEAGTASTGSVPSWDAAAEATEQALLAARRPRVALIHNMVSPYRLAVFEELARTCNLVVLFTQAISKDRRWDHRLEGFTFPWRVLPAVRLGPVVYNPGGLGLLRRLRFDVLVTNTDPDTAPLSLSGLLVARLRRRPVIVWSEATGDTIQTYPQLAYATTQPLVAIGRGLVRLVAWYRGPFLRSSHSALAFSEAARQYLLRRGVPQDKVVRTHQVMPVVLLPGADGASRARTGKRILYLGYLNKGKDVAALVDAFRTVDDPQARLTVAGSGPEEAELRRRASGDHRIEFVGYVDGQAKADLYGRCDVMVLPTRHDCWGLVVNEAIHYGLAVVVSDGAAARELVDPQTGIVVPAGDVGALGAALTLLLRDRGLLAAMQAHNLRSPDVSDVGRAARPIAAAISAAVT